MSFKTTPSDDRTAHPQPSTSRQQPDPREIDFYQADPDEQILRLGLLSLFADLSRAIDLHLDQLLQSNISCVETVTDLAHVEGLLSKYSHLATQWRPSDTLHAIHDDLVSHIADVQMEMVTSCLVAPLEPRPSSESSVPDRHRPDYPTDRPDRHRCGR